ncbi:MAG: hypothetical protein ACM33T_10730 [Solirubrobacterales bacterium]
MKRAPLAAAALVALAGCYTIRYERRGVTPEAGAPREVWNHGALGGTIPASRGGGRPPPAPPRPAA